jgi:glycerate dehydrogenase
MNIKNKDRLIITPHIAWASKEARARLIKSIKDNISNFTL